MDAIREIEAWLRKSGISESRLGLLSAANQNAVANIRSGVAKVATLDAVLAYVRANPTKKSARSSA